MAKVATLTEWRNILANIRELDDDDEFGNDVEIIWLDDVPGPGEWVLAHGYECFEDGFKTEDEAIARLEHVLKVVDMEPVAGIGVSNTGGVLIYECDSDYVLAGCDDELPEYYEVLYELPEDAEDDEDADTEPVFYMGEWQLSLSEAMRFDRY